MYNQISLSHDINTTTAIDFVSKKIKRSESFSRKGAMTAPNIASANTRSSL